MSAFEDRLREIQQECETQEAELRELFLSPDINPQLIVSQLMKLNTRIRLLAHFLLPQNRTGA